MCLDAPAATARPPRRRPRMATPSVGMVAFRSDVYLGNAQPPCVGPMRAWRSMRTPMNRCFAAPRFVAAASAVAARAAVFACPRPWTARRWSAARTAVATPRIPAIVSTAHRARSPSAALDSGVATAAASRCWRHRARPFPSAPQAKGCSAAHDDTGADDRRLSLHQLSDRCQSQG
jgi:hypothetical protein